MRRRKALISFKAPERSKLIHPEMDGGLGWIPGDKGQEIPCPRSPLPWSGLVEDLTLLCPLKTSNSQLSCNFRVGFRASGQTGSRTSHFL